MSHDQLRPADDPDYQRLVKVIEVIEEEARRVGPRRVLDRRFDYETAMHYGMRRTEEVSSGAELERLKPRELVTLLGASWPEGFAFGSLAYTQERRGRRSEAFLDRIALANIKQTLVSTDDAGRSAIFSGVASTEALGYVGGMRSRKAIEALRANFPAPDRRTLEAFVAGHWLDAFFVGLVFEELHAKEQG